MGTRERRERQRCETRHKILAAAREMFEQEGYQSVTMRAIADRIEYTPTALYHHFRSKHDLLTELCLSDFAELGRNFRRRTKGTDPIGRVRAAAETYLRFAEEHPGQYRFLFMTVLPPLTPDDARPLRARQYHPCACLRQAYADAITEGRLRPEYDDPDALAQMLWGAVHGHVLLHMSKKFQEFVPYKNLGSMGMTTIETLLRGLLRKR